MFLHLSNDDKFFDYVIENCELVAPGKHAYFVKKKDDNIRFVKYKNVISISSAQDFFSRVTDFSAFKIIYIHFLIGFSIDIVLGLPKNIKIVWIFWGADGYQLPRLRKYLLLSHTQAILNELKTDTAVTKFKRTIRRIVFGDQRKLRSAVHRIDYCATWVEADYNLVRHYNPRMKYIYFSNYNIYQLTGFPSPPTHLDSEDVVWVGNSGYPSNNHYEVFVLLSKVGWQGRVICPLSYGDNQYIEKIIEIGKSFFGDRFKPLTEFMDKESYHGLLISSKFMVMNHTRQQGGGNTLTALWLGIPLFMNSMSTLFQTYKAWGLDVFSLEEFNGALQTRRVDVIGNRSILLKYLGENAVTKSFRDILFLQN
jgi:dTDP-N-acetylfucosamine:lipid II N-acetylfucosaminyltransferase